MFWFIEFYDSQYVDPNYRGYEVWHDLIRACGKYLVFEQIFITVVFIAIWSVGFHRESGTGATTHLKWKRLTGALSNALIGSYMIFNATGLVWVYQRSLVASWGPFIIFFTLVYLTGGSWLIARAISSRKSGAWSSVPLIHDDKRLGGFFATGIIVLIPVSSWFYYSHLAFTALVTPIIAVAGILMIRRKAESAEWKPRVKKIIGLLFLWVGIFLFVCFLQRTVLLENGWHLLRRLMTSLAFLLFGTYLCGDKTSKTSTIRNWRGNRALKIAAVLAVIVPVWRFSATALMLPSMRSTMNHIRSDMERNNCNRLGEIAVDLPVLSSGYYYGSHYPDCDKWYQVMYVGKAKSYMNPTALYPYYYYGNIKLTNEITLDKIKSELSEIHEYVRKYPDELGDSVLLGVDNEAPWSRVLAAVNSITSAGFNKIAFMFQPFYKSEIGELLADPPWMLRNIEEYRDTLMYYGGSKLYFCSSPLDKVGAFCPGVHNSNRWWGSQGSALDRYQHMTIGHMTESYAWCLGDMDLRAFETVMAFMFWQQPLTYIVVTIAPEDDAEARVLSLSANQRWEKAHAELIGFVKDDRRTRDQPVRLTAK
jgi:hypothetical protein